ncbi:MAG: hypothetical protein RIT28_3714 [Pseudomonadota bacterium]|jgi:hypothetical protein
MPADPLAALTVLTPAGDPVPLPSLWAQGPVVLVFVRHFG